MILDKSLHHHSASSNFPFNYESKSPKLPPESNSLSVIEHSVSKMDTMAGIAIKYGVEVADIRSLNGLVTDLQMFGLNSLRIQIPGRHPPSPSPCSATPPRNWCARKQSRWSSDIMNSLGTLRKASSSDLGISPTNTEYQMADFGKTGSSRCARMCFLRMGKALFSIASPICKDLMPKLD